MSQQEDSPTTAIETHQLDAREEPQPDLPVAVTAPQHSNQSAVSNPARRLEPASHGGHEFNNGSRR